MPAQVRESLIAAAREVRERAYAPYSTYLVGCALLADGIIYTGGNVENASYGLTLCAERVACANAALAGVRDIEVCVVITSSSPPAAPCGMCLQTLREFSIHPSALTIIMINTAGEERVYTLAELSPHAFHKDQITP
jgi:cytidine deaminase